MKITIHLVLALVLSLICMNAFSVENINIEDTATKEWNTFLEPLEPIARELIDELKYPEDAQRRYEMYSALISQIGSAYQALLYADPEHPDFWPIYSTSVRNQSPNPDNVYWVTPIDDDGVYKLSGFRNTVKRVSITIGTGTLYTLGTMEGGPIGSVGEYDLDDLTLGEDGTFEVLISPEKPKNYNGDWWKLNPKGTHIFLRQTSYDWLGEEDARVAIDRLDRPAQKPRLSAEDLAKKLAHFGKYALSSVEISAIYQRMIRKKYGFNNMGYIDNTEWAPVVTQRYAYGVFDLQPDEALIIEAKLPECRYWSIHLMDYIGVTLDYVNRQTSINGHTAQVDTDGYFRTVISAKDPGVPNWLDNEAYKAGAIQSRWEHCNFWPEFTTSKVKLADVRQHLPANTPAVSVEQRDASIRLRRKGAQLRNRW